MALHQTRFVRGAWDDTEMAYFETETYMQWLEEI